MRAHESRGEPKAGQTHRAIDGEALANHYLAGLRTRQTDPDELAAVVAALHGESLRCFCLVIAKALGGNHA